MKKVSLFSLLITLGFLLSACFHAKDNENLTRSDSGKNMFRLSIQDALADARTNGDIDNNIQLSFGDQGHSGRLWTSIKRTNATNKTTKEACNRAFMSAILSLQKRAKEMGKSTVVDIYSYHKKKKFSSDTEFECQDGKLMNAVTLQGRVE